MSLSIKSWSILKAIPQFAQYWYRNAHDQPPTGHEPNKHLYRSIFSSDRDRVMYCSSFRRLSSKTQVFDSSTADNLRTRLTHTLEVAQIARTISQQLGLDEELTEAIALAHDLGHTPFGHVGERTLNEFSHGNDKKTTLTIPDASKGFKHNLQSVRVLAEYSENVKFSNYMLYGVREHSNRFWKNSNDVAFYELYNSYCCIAIGDKLYPAWTIEAFIVKWADEIAQRHHDIEDAYLQKIMPASDIIEKIKPLNNISQDSHINNKFERLQAEVDKLARKSSYTNLSFAHTLSSFLVDAYVTLIIKEINRVLTHFCNLNGIETREIFEKNYISISEMEIQNLMSLRDSKIFEIDKELGQQLKYSIIDSYEVQRMDGKGAYIIRKLLRAYISNPQQLPNEFLDRFIKIELPRSLSKKDHTELFTCVKDKIGYRYTDNVFVWKDYECREALRIMMNDADLLSLAYPALLRTVFDYVAGMTDSYALLQFNELY